MDIGAIHATTPEKIEKDFIKNENTVFLSDVKNVRFNLELSGNYVDLSGNISISAEYFNNDVVPMQDFNIITLDDDRQSLTQDGSSFIISNINVDKDKLIGVEIVDRNNRKFTQMILICLNEGYHHEFEYNIPNYLQYKFKKYYNIYKKTTHEDQTYIVKITSDERPRTYVEKINSNSNLLINNDVLGSTLFNSISHLDKEAFIKLPKMKLKEVKIFDHNNNELTEFDIGKAYNYHLVAVFIENDREVEIPIPNEDIDDIKFTGFNDIIRYNKNSIWTDTTKTLYYGIVDINFFIESQRFFFQKQMIVRGHLSAKIYGTIICSDGSNRIEYPFNAGFSINELEGGDNEIYTRDVVINPNIDLNNKFFIALKNIRFDQNITCSQTINLEFATSTGSTYDIDVEKYNTNYMIPINVGAFQKANKLTKMSLSISFRGADILI